MKKYTIIATILLLAVSCGKKSEPVVSVPTPEQNQSTQNGSAATTPSSPSATSTKPTVPTKPLTLSVYKDPAGVFSINYTSDFILSSKAGKSENTSACSPLGSTPKVCFVFKGAPYKATNLNSAAVSVRTLAGKTDLGKCGQFEQADLGDLGHLENPVSINGVTFVTAMFEDAGAGNHHRVRMNRTFYNNQCYEIDETIAWANAENFDPPRQEVDKAEVLMEMDAVRGNFRFNK